MTSRHAHDEAPGFPSPVYESMSVKTAAQWGLNSVYQPSTSKRQNNRLLGRCIQDLREEASRSFSIERNTNYQSFPTLISLAKAGKLFFNSSHKATESMKRSSSNKNCAAEAPEGDSIHNHSALCDAGDRE
jgi:hypothetical protein